jgi:hypothetical protein
MTPIWIILAVIVVLTVVIVGLNVGVRRTGYAIPGRTPARCSAGHLFLMNWVMGGSLTMVRLGPLKRWGRCPVGHHWATVRPVKDADLSAEERRSLYGEA